MTTRNTAEERAYTRGDSFSGQVARDRARLHVGHTYTYNTSYQQRSGSIFRLLFGSKKLNTELIDAAKHGYVQRLEVLLKNGANVDFKDKQQMIALHHAALNNHPDCVRMLLEAGSVVNAQDTFMETPIYFAALNSNEQIVRMLLATPGFTIIGNRGPEGSVLDVAVLRGDLALVTAIVQHASTMSAAQRAQLNLPAKPTSPIWAAISSRSCAFAPMIYGSALGFLVNCSPLGLAVMLGRLEIVQALWEFRNPSGNEVRTERKKGLVWVPLPEIAVEFNQNLLLAWLLDSQTETSSSTLDSLLLRAVKRRFPDLEELLLERGASPGAPVPAWSPNPLHISGAQI